MALRKVAIRNDFKGSQLLEINVETKKIILVEYQGNIKAFQGECPHQGASLAQGHIVSGHLVCPLHQRHYSCETGKHNFSSECLKSYVIAEKDGSIFIDVEPDIKPETKKAPNKIISIDDLPSPKGDFFVGHLSQFKVPATHLVLERWVKEAGDLFQINFVGKKFIVSADHDINRQILKSRPGSFRRFSKIGSVLEEMGILGTFNAEGEMWEKHRRLTAEALNFKNTKSYFSTIALITGRLLKRWQKFAESNQEIDAQKELMRYTVDITTAIAFGYDTNTLEKDSDIIQRHLEKVFPMVNHRISAPIPFWRFIKMEKDRVLDKALSEIKKTIDEFILAARKRLEEQPALQEDPTNFLEALLVQQQKEGNFSDREIFGNVFTILLAGEDTTSNSVSWILYYLAQHQEVIRKVREEADLLYGDKVFPDTYEQVSQLKYTEAVAQEAMRLKPVTPTLYMEALEDVVVNNLKIKKGTSIMLQNKVAHTAVENFAEPEKFVPERWISGKCPFSGAHRSEVIQTFGNGPRFCPGKNLAMVEMVMATSMICKNFDFELSVLPESVEEVFAFTMYPKNLRLKLKRRRLPLVAPVMAERMPGWSPGM